MSAIPPDEGKTPGSVFKETATEYRTHTHAATLADIVDKARVLIGTDGRPAAMQIDIADWSALMGWLEDVEDAQLMRERFRERSQRAVTAWEDFEAELKTDGLL